AGGGAPAAAKWGDDQKARQQATVARIEAALKQDKGGLRIPGRVTAAVRGQIERLDRALAEALRVPGKPGFDKLQATTENALLAFDAIVDALGDRDARGAALK